jgi:mono/diheme cytochrome c family protein
MLSMLHILRKSLLIVIGFVITFALTMTMSERIGLAQGDLIRGRALYGANCARCHGEMGKGDGPRAGELQKKPINFTDPQLMKAVTPEKFERSVVEGLPNITWHTFGHLLSPNEVLVVTEYVRSLIR